MFCPATDTQNDAMATHCFQRRTQLIFPEQDRSSAVNAVARNLDARMYGGIGYGVFFIFGYALRQTTAAGIFSGLVGALLGGHIAGKKTRGFESHT